MANAGYDVRVATIGVSSRETAHAPVETSTGLGVIIG